MDMTKLRYFVEAAGCGGFTEAARRLYTSQPNISKQISALEAELGTRLFIRENRAVRLTAAGEYLYDKIKALPDELDRIFETTRALGREDRGQLTIGTLAGQVLNADIVNRFALFSRLYPDLQYTLERAGFAALREALLSFQYDMIITFAFDVSDEANFAVETISKQSNALFVSRSRPVPDMNDLSSTPFIAISPKESLGGYKQLLRFCEMRGFQPHIVRMADSLDSLLFYIETGVGVAVLDRNTRLETDSNIRVIPVQTNEAPNMVAAWLRSNTNQNIRKMVDCLKEQPAGSR